MTNLSKPMMPTLPEDAPNMGSEMSEYPSCMIQSIPEDIPTKRMWAHTLTVQDYQDLIDRGWRRSGQYCYKPIMDVTCCPLYTIKCEALEFKPSKSQKKILKKMHKMLAEGVSNKEVKAEIDCGSSSGDNEGGCINDVTSLHDKALCAVSSRNIAIEHFDGLNGSCDSCERVDLPETSCGKSSFLPEAEHNTTPRSLNNNFKNPRNGIGRDISKPLCKKAKIIRLERKQTKLLEKREVPQCSNNKNQVNEVKTLEDYLNEPFPKEPAHTLELRLVCSSPMSDELQQTFNAELELYQKYQVSVHRDPPEKCTKQQFTKFLVKSPLTVRLVASQADDNNLEESWRLYVKYQTIIHKDSEEECSFSNYINFLVDSPFKQQKSNKYGPSCGYGSFHQQYWLDGKLIAVGVVDVLPKCLSSVYFFYDPDYSYLTLGTYGSLREVAFIRSLVKEVPTIKHYYMGFYVHNCPKMRYKAKLYPSYLLCPELYSWHPIESCIPKLDTNKYSRLNDDKNAVSKDSEIDINNVLVLWDGTAMHYSKYKTRSNFSNDEFILQYGSLVGKKCAERMFLFMQ